MPWMMVFMFIFFCFISVTFLVSYFFSHKSSSCGCVVVSGVCLPW